MSQENVEVVQAVYALGLDPEVLDRAFDEYLTADFELRPPEDYPDAETYRGLEGILRWRRMIGETWGEWRFEPRDFYDAGDRVAVRVRIVAQGEASGVPLDRETGHVWSVREGRATSVRVYLDPAEALEAVGLSERAMSRENVEVVRRAIEASHSENLTARTEELVAFWHPACEWTSAMAALEPHTYLGHDGIRRYLSDIASAWTEWRNEVEELFALGPNTVLATVRTRVTGRDSGAPTEARLGVVFEVSDGKLLRAHSYPTREEALEAVGLSE